ncbi:MAG: hypothetical protein KJ592_03815 [Nanoarchaeota archaeon]|nr:hypothetical protein [Nanoarchaeota archaeon]
MKYQKSMLKLMENILEGKGEKNIEVLIREAKTGRNSSFEALGFLEEMGFVRIKKLGNQKSVSLVRDNSVLQFKYYLDLMEFKSLDPLVKLVVDVFVFSLFNKKKIKSALLFGSVLKGKGFNDIDILLLGDLRVEDVKSFDEVRSKIERFFGVILNLHRGDFNFDNLFRGVVVYQSSYVLEYTKAQRQYFEFLDSVYDAIVGKEKSLFDVSLVNLSYVYCFSEGFFPRAKVDALDFFNKEYKVRNLNDLKKVGVEIGKKIFR